MSWHNIFHFFIITIDMRASCHAHTYPGCMCKPACLWTVWGHQSTQRHRDTERSNSVFRLDILYHRHHGEIYLLLFGIPHLEKKKKNRFDYGGWDCFSKAPFINIKWTCPPHNSSQILLLLRSHASSESDSHHWILFKSTITQIK